MAEYVPTTRQVRDAFANTPSGLQVPTLETAFDRWLAAHDAAVKAEALREAAEDFQKAWPVYGDDWLRARADRIEARDA